MFVYGQLKWLTMEQHILKIVKTCLNANIYSYLETSGGQSYNPYLNVVHFSTQILIRYLWQLKTVVFLHWCLICAVLLQYSTNFPWNLSTHCTLRICNVYSTGPNGQFHKHFTSLTCSSSIISWVSSIAHTQPSCILKMPTFLQP